MGSNPVRVISFLYIFLIAGWSSLVARRAHNPKVVGSNPAPAIMVRWSSWFRTPACHAGDHGFESRTNRVTYNYASLRRCFFCALNSQSQTETNYQKRGELMNCIRFISNDDFPLIL